MEVALRDTTCVQSHAGKVLVRRAFWQIELEEDWVRSHPAFADFLERKRPLSHLDSSSPELADVVTLLGSIGSISVQRETHRYSGSELLNVFRPLQMQWYGEYYAHPVWPMLRDGVAPRGVYAAWFIYNYYVSMSAGATDSRAAIYSKRRGMQRRFARNALEEYSHCKQYFDLTELLPEYSPETLQTAVPFPSNRAFDQQMLRLAEQDEVAHLLVSYFQECTEHFADQCRRFFTLTSTSLGSPRAFDSWIEHLELDGKYGHAKRLERTLARSTRTFSVRRVIAILTQVRAAIRFLNVALDEVAACDMLPCRLRLPFSGGLLDRGQSSLMDIYPEALTFIRVEGGSVLNVVSDLPLPNLAHTEKAADSVFARDGLWLIRSIGALLLRALSFAENREALLAIGDAAKSLLVSTGKFDSALSRLPQSAYCLAVHNFLWAAAIQSMIFAALTIRVCQGVFSHSTDARVQSMRNSVTAALDGYMARSALAAHELDTFATKLVEFDHLIVLWFREKRDISKFDPFTY